MTTKDELDFSVKTVPDGWNQAGEQAPSAGTGRRPTRRGGPKVMPSRRKVDVFSASFLGVALALATGTGWVLVESTEDRWFWWAPIVVALLISVGVRIAGGTAAPGVTMALSSGLFCVTILAAGVAIARLNLLDQNVSVSLDTLETRLVSDQFTRSKSWLGLLGGFVAAAITSFAGVNRS